METQQKIHREMCNHKICTKKNCDVKWHQVDFLLNFNFMSVSNCMLKPLFFINDTWMLEHFVGPKKLQPLSYVVPDEKSTSHLQPLVHTIFLRHQQFGSPKTWHRNPLGVLSQWYQFLSCQSSLDSQYTSFLSIPKIWK